MICPYLVTLPEGGAFGSAMSRVFPERVYEGLSRCVRELDWHEARREFYRQRERKISCHPAFEKIFDRTARQGMADAVGDFFGASISADFDIAAHKMIEGDYIAAHTDENDFDEEFRLTVTLNERWSIEQGGILLTLRSGSMRDVEGAWLPSHNNGFLFQISERSFHAVTPVKSEIARYSLIFTFKRSQAPYKNDVWRRWYPFPFKSDVSEAQYNAEVMGLDLRAFDAPYTRHAFSGKEEFDDFVDGTLLNAPQGLSYSRPGSRNVDERGQQPRGSDAERLAKIAELERIPPIALVRKVTGEYVLVNGSHRPSHAVDRGTAIAATIFSEPASA